MMKRSRHERKAQCHQSLTFAFICCAEQWFSMLLAFREKDEHKNCALCIRKDFGRFRSPAASHIILNINKSSHQILFLHCTFNAAALCLSFSFCLLLFLGCLQVLYWVVSRHMSLLHLLQMTFIIKEEQKRNFRCRKKEMKRNRKCLFRRGPEELLAKVDRALVTPRVVYFNYFTSLNSQAFALKTSLLVFLFTSFAGVWRTSTERTLGGFHFYCQQMIHFLLLTRLQPTSSFLMEFFIIYLLFFFSSTD